MTDYQRLISGFYFVYYASAATLLPNLPLIFDDAGYSGSQIGWLLALPPAISIVAAPTWSALADVTGRGRALLSAALVGTATAALALGVTAVYDLYREAGKAFAAECWEASENASDQ